MQRKHLTEFNTFSLLKKKNTQQTRNLGKFISPKKVSMKNLQLTSYIMMRD